MPGFKTVINLSASSLRNKRSLLLHGNQTTVVSKMQNKLQLIRQKSNIKIRLHASPLIGCRMTTPQKGPPRTTCCLSTSETSLSGIFSSLTTLRSASLSSHAEFDACPITVITIAAMCSKNNRNAEADQGFWEIGIVREFSTNSLRRYCKPTAHCNKHDRVDLLEEALPPSQAPLSFTACGKLVYG